MEAVPTVAIVFGSLVAIVAIITNAITRSIRRDSAKSAGEEARLIQEMHRQLSNLEHRIETLETIISHPPAMRRRKE